MPIYEYRCQSCNRKISVFFKSFSEVGEASCSHCGSVDLTRLMSRFTVIKGWGDFMKDMPSGDMMSDFDEDDPRSAAEMLRRWKDEMGEDIGPEGEEMIARMDAGEMSDEFGGMGGDWDD